MFIVYVQKYSYLQFISNSSFLEYLKKNHINCIIISLSNKVRLFFIDKIKYEITVKYILLVDYDVCFKIVRL
jgi:hypothetical protein